MREAAAELDCSTRSVRRWIAAGVPAPAARRLLIDEELYGSYLCWHGNIAAVRREFAEAGREVPGLRTLQRAFARELRPAERAAARSGEQAIRAHGLYVRWEADHRNRGVAGRS